MKNNIALRDVVFYFKRGIVITQVRGKFTFPQDSYWQISGRNRVKRMIALKDVQHGKEQWVTFNIIGDFMSLFNEDAIYLMASKDVPKLLS